MSRADPKTPDDVILPDPGKLREKLAVNLRERKLLTSLLRILERNERIERLQKQTPEVKPCRQ